MTNTLRSADGRVIVPASLRHRRITVQRDRGRRRLHRLIALGVVVGLCLIMLALLRSPLLAVRTVTVRGSSHLTTSQAKQIANISDGMAMMDASPKRIAKSLETSPWIAHAQVERSWPNTLTITLRDRVPAAQLRDGEGFAIVDGTGKVLERQVRRVEHLPELSGVGAVPPGSRVHGANELITVANAMPASLTRSVASIGRDRHGAFAVVLNSGGVVRLGSGSDLTSKFSSLRIMLDRLGRIKHGCTLDVAVPTAPLVTPEYACG